VDGESALLAEFSYGVNDWWYTAAIAQFESGPGGDLELHDIGWENLIELTGTRDDLFRTRSTAKSNSRPKTASRRARIQSIAEYRQRREFPLQPDLRARVRQQRSDVTEFGYAVRAVRYVDDHVALGVEGFGDLGTSTTSATRSRSIGAR